jgi:acetyl-CoA acetyltransferase
VRDVVITGAGMTAFGKHLDRTLASLSEEATYAALADAGLEPGAVDTTYVGNAGAGLITGQEMIRGQVALRGVPLGGGPIANVESACASGSLAVHLAWLAVASGEADVALALGVEKLIHPDKQVSFDAIESGTDLGPDADTTRDGGSVMMGAYAAEARHYAARYGVAIEDALAEVAVKNRAAASHNPRAQFQTPITREDVLASRLVADPLRLLTCSPLTDGASALILRAADAVTGDERAVTIRASAVRSFDGIPPAPRVVERAAQAAYARAGIGPGEVDVLQLHDASAFAELIQYEQIGLVAAGGAAELVLAGEAGLGGRYPTNTDGGLLSRGHALGATGVAQLFELVTQLRGEAGDRQVPGAKLALAANSGGWMGTDYAAGVVTVLAA